ncbi:helix-turn-helix domain-containing protein [Amycolatopsis mediterranei S699]|uniref:Helix-turn-helix domain-containing protein n=1 Tax=Amycolatopsis mediterranei (strain S699) TaxID=713604 RepID=A0A9R0U972_AMYMS|nr:helix-turn-helix domain-containing protein [Amycolatopsis mediterranei S699]
MEAWEFGRTVRRWRDRAAPESVGVPVGRRRRAEGLRREELATLAGISADYLTRLEQGRATAPSAQVVESLARALRLSDTERDLLYQLAGHAAPGRDVVSSRVPPSVQRLLDRLSHTPVVVYDATWTLVLANAPYDALMGDTTSWRGLERNAVWRNVTRLPARVVHTEQEQAEHEARLVADLRLTASRYPADRALRPHLVWACCKVGDIVDQRWTMWRSGARSRCGCWRSRCCPRRRNATRAVVGGVWMTVWCWRPSCMYCRPDVPGQRCRRRSGSVPRPRIAGLPSGSRRRCSPGCTRRCWICSARPGRSTGHARR